MDARTKLFLLLFSAALSARAQLAEPLIFRETIFNFGEIREEQGPVEHDFIFTNNSGRPVKILSVQASCGCTTPEWTQTPIAPGRTGSIKARFDPAGRPGYFNKSLTLTTDLNTPIVLQIKGQVDPKGSSVSAFPVVMGSLRFPSRSVNFGKLYLNKEPVTTDFLVRNDGEKEVRFMSVEKPGYFNVATPSSLAPKQEGKIRITYDARARNVFGFVTDNISLVTDDAEGEVKSLPVYATLEEYYPVPAPDELQKAPVLTIKEPSVDVGRYRPGIVIERVVMVSNTGKKPLQLKALQGNCNCITAEPEKKTLSPGDSAAIRIIFKPQNRGGTQQKAITIYSNDPRNPVQRINVAAFIED